MNLQQIANDMKQNARQFPGKTVIYNFPGGASVYLKRVPAADASGSEWHMKIQRAGVMPRPDDPFYKYWEREIATFRKPEFFDVPGTCETTMRQATKTAVYAAIMVWADGPA